MKKKGKGRIIYPKKRRNEKNIYKVILFYY